MSQIFQKFSGRLGHSINILIADIHLFPFLRKLAHNEINNHCDYYHDRDHTHTVKSMAGLHTPEFFQ